MLCKAPLRTVVTILLAVLVFFLLPVLILITWTPMFVIRCFISKIAKFIKPNLGKMQSTLGSVYAVDDKFRKPNSNLVIQGILKGDIPIKEIYETIEKRWMEARFPNGELKYPELQSYLTKWCGFYFWTLDKNFDLSDHVKVYNQKGSGPNGGLTDSDVLELREELTNKKWEKTKPLWELVKIENYENSDGLEVSGEDKKLTAYIFRIHHSLADGVSLLNLGVFDSIDKQEEFKNAVSNAIQFTTWEKFMFFIKAPFTISYILADILFVMPTLNVPWRVSPQQQKLHKVLIDLTERFPVTRIKDIKSHFDVSFSSVIFAIFAGAHREMLIRKKLVIPTELLAMIPLPVPNHSLKLRNQHTGVEVSLPVGEPDPVKRLKAASHSYKQLKKSPFPLVMNCLARIVGTNCSCILKYLAPTKHYTTGLSIFPGGSQPVCFLGNELLDCSFNSQLLNGCGGLGVAVLSYNETIRMCVMGSSEILSKEDLHQMTIEIQKQIDLLYKYLT